MQKDTAIKLLQYSALTGGILSLVDKSVAQVIYTDIDPDIILFQEVNEDEGWKYIDFDGDGSNDVGLHRHDFYGFGYCPTQRFFEVELYGENEIAFTYDEPCPLYGAFGSTCYFAPVKIADYLIEGDTINAFKNWDQIEDIFETFFCSYPFGDNCIQVDSIPGGYDDYYLGFKIINIDTTYCWLRLMQEDFRLLIKDYGCSSIADTGIIPDITEADIAQNIELITDTCTGNAEEFTVIFDKAPDESTLIEYRIIIDDNPSLVIYHLLDVAPENYISILPTGSDVEIKIPPGFNDKNGDDLVPFITYYAYIVSINNYPSIIDPSFTVSSGNQFGVNSFASAPEFLSLYNSTYTYSSADLVVSSIFPIDIALTDSFKIILVKPEESIDFTIEDANSAIPANSFIIPASEVFTVNLPVNMVDWKGDIMLPEQLYKAIVLAGYKDEVSCIDELGNFSGKAKFKENPLSVLVPIDESMLNYFNGNIHIELPQSLNFQLVVCDIMGKNIFLDSFSTDNLDIKLNLTAGIYFITLKFDEIYLTKKIFSR